MNLKPLWVGGLAAIVTIGSLPACNRTNGESQSTSSNEQAQSSEGEREERADRQGERDRRDRRRPRGKQLPAPSDVSEPPDDAERTDSGLAHKQLSEGTGTEHPGPQDRVTVDYTGWTTDGEMFDSSVVRGRPARFPLNKVIKGWTEGLQLMVEGEKRRLWIPEELAYKGRRGAPQGMLVFDVELLGIEKAPEPLPAPDNVAAPPEDAERTESGLAHKQISKGTGTTHPEETSKVKVHYSGWTTDGEMFDSSVVRGRPATFPLNKVIKGWTEGLQLMVEGEKRRLWIPEELAYKGRRGAPQGMLVFDVELLEIVDQ